jgi:two-component system NarL family response regulator
MKIRVILADDHQMFVDLLKTCFALESDIEVVGEANSGRAVLSILEQVIPDILVLDIDMREVNGIEVAHRVTKQYPSVRILALSGHAEIMYVEDMLKAGAHGYVVKSSGADTLISAIREVAKGGSFLSPEIAMALVRRFQSHHEAVIPPQSVLGSREKDVLRQVASGKPSVEIAESLGIAEGTVESHRRNIKRKLGIYSTAELTRYAVREGLIVP